jgi:hypothetical protein
MIFFNKEFYESNIDHFDYEYQLKIGSLVFQFIEEDLNIYLQMEYYKDFMFQVKLPISSEYSYVEDFIEFIRKYKEEIELSVVLGFIKNKKFNFYEYIVRDFLRANYKNYDVIVMMT